MFRSSNNKGLRLLKKIKGDSLIFFGFSEWKYSIFKKIFDEDIIFITQNDANTEEFFSSFVGKSKLFKGIYVWSYFEPFWLVSYCKNVGIDFYRVEDGFMRSIGLGASRVNPRSLIFDNSGYLFFDAIRDSALHKIIRGADFSDSLFSSDNLKEKFIEANVSKYNLKNNTRELIPNDCILVIGQNERDLSILKSGSIFSTNESLLRHVMKIRDGQKIIYKSHPDVLNNPSLRTSFPENISGVQVVHNLGILLRNAHKVREVHTISSLLGFEFMLRNVSVYCYSRTWYSGWGLSHDCYHSNDENLGIGIDELFISAYILYPIYYAQDYNQMCFEESLNRMCQYVSENFS